MTTVAAPSLRWSSVRNCSRLAVYEATGAPHRERTQREENTLARGKDVGRGFVIRLANGQRPAWKVWVDSGTDYWVPPEFRADSEGDADVIAELRVPWELGVGHVDLFVKETDSVLEVLSSQNASAEMVHSKLLQAAGYCRALGATSIALAIVDPVDYSEDRVVVTESSSRWGELMAEVDERIAQVLAWRDRDELPARVCSKPSESFGRFCLYPGHCFNDAPPWTPHDFDGQLQSEDAQQLAIQLAHVKAKRRELSATDKTFEREQKEIQEQLAEYVPDGKFQVGGYLVTRSDRTRRSFNLTLADQDSRFDGLLDEFVKTSSFSVWDVEKTGPVLVLHDGDEEVPF